MAYEATVIEIMIASPGDVVDERKIVRDTIAEWNTIYARDRSIVLLPVGWDTHSSPELGGRPQQMINDRLLAHADILVGIFWTRVGSPTGKAISGSIEEIEEHLKQNKPVMLYFSSVPVRASSVDRDQYEKLEQLKSWAMERGLIEQFETKEEFKEKFRRHLHVVLRENLYLRRITPQKSDAGPTGLHGIAFQQPSGISISNDAREILVAAAGSKDGMITVLHYIGGTAITANGKQFNEADNRRSIARWEAAVHELRDRGMVQDRSGKGEIFEVTDAGYRFVEEML